MFGTPHQPTVNGIDDDVKKALQPLFDIFADEGIGQATFEVTDVRHVDVDGTPDAGLLFICLADEPPADFDEVVARIDALLPREHADTIRGIGDQPVA